MSTTTPFQEYTARYENWFTDHPLAYEAEIRAVRTLLPRQKGGIEVGVGTGRFAARLGIILGIEPAAAMRRIAEQRGIHTIGAKAEFLPLHNALFNFVLMVTVVCFLDDVYRAFAEARRVLRNKGCLVVGIIDRNSPLGREYVARQAESIFYRDAAFLSAVEVMDVMRQAGFHRIACCQTILRAPATVTIDEPVLPGHGQGLFAVLRGETEGRNPYENI
jgi:SAM-dependent methyltransferase